MTWIIVALIVLLAFIVGTLLIVVFFMGASKNYCQYCHSDGFWCPMCGGGTVPGIRGGSS